MTEQICVGCGKSVETTLTCPKCAELHLPRSYFCSQSCFKECWPKHKLVHKTVKLLRDGGGSMGYTTIKNGFNEENENTWALDVHLRPFLGYSFTGDLRPWPITPLRSAGDVAAPDYATHPEGVCNEEEVAQRTQAIYVNSEDELKRLRTAGVLARSCLDLAHRMAQPGVTTEEIDVAVHKLAVDAGAYPSPLNYYNFPKSCCTSVNEVVCHGIPDLRPLQDGDILNVDITVFLDGMHADCNETFAIGTIDEESKALIEAAYEGLAAGIKICKPGIPYKAIGNAISTSVEKKKFTVTRTYTGHGVGRLFHTKPNIPHYRKNKAVGIMEAGQSFTIEPMINAGLVENVTWPDDWTAVTVDGKRSAQFEHTFVITETGYEVITKRNEDSPPLCFDITKHPF